ncbi:membrane protein [Kitasatospora herbaricolor]|uniref:DUF1269 domain-containing protein n=1 Tax=Kitasatospora herbaricolor TaxID=68217 RepID=UPI00174A731F|nr:DUF1269 domain-containing protein [Kitasatospora herbaricolor]MDQ0306023.1 putative membrane protein [Kitasatospora herbaricolor]GGV23824.1 membrane protein [Kitasatospora herbaricolor]
MPTLTVWRFPTPTGADAALESLKELHQQQLITVQDGAVVNWPEGAKKPRTRHLANLTGRGALGGAFWGMLFGVIFLVPILGLAVGAAFGALGGSLAKAGGIDEDFIRQVRESVTPGTSALFVLSSDAVLDRIRTAFEGWDAELIQTNLSAEEESRLREAFSEDHESH